MLGEVAVVALVEALESEQPRGWPGGSGGPLAEPVEGCRVICVTLDGSFLEVKALDTTVVVQEVPSQLEVGVRDPSSWVGEGREVLADAGRETSAPDNRVQFCVTWRRAASSETLVRGACHGGWVWKPDTTSTRT